MVLNSMLIHLITPNRDGKMDLAFFSGSMFGLPSASMPVKTLISVSLFHYYDVNHILSHIISLYYRLSVPLALAVSMFANG
jgi:hypothetical protein